MGRIHWRGNLHHYIWLNCKLYFCKVYLCEIARMLESLTYDNAALWAVTLYDLVPSLISYDVAETDFLMLMFYCLSFFFFFCNLPVDWLVYFFFPFQLSYGLVQYDYFVCPVRYDEEKDHISMECERSPAFVLTEYNWPETVRTILLLVSWRMRLWI